MKRRQNSLSLILILLLSLLTEYMAADSKKPKFRNVVYYADWSIYEGQKKFTLDKVDGSLITHLNFAFLDVDANGELITTDTWSDYENPNVGFNVGYENKFAGVLGGFVLLRQKYPNMKIGISVGGWTRSGDFPKVASTESSRKKFAQNVGEFLHYYGYDFIDIDWEYPTADRDPDPDGNGVAIDKGCKGSEADTENFTLLLQALRDELNKYEGIDGKHYELSVAMSASPSMMAKIEYDKVLKIIDYANMMTYDFNGSWTSFTGHHTALYTNPSYDPETQPDAALSVDTCIKYLEDTYGDSIDYSKIVVGVAPYTKSWTNVKSSTGKDKKNPGLFATGKGEAGATYAYEDLKPLITKNGLKEYWDDNAKANYFYGEESGYFYTCDTEKSVAEKGKYVQKKKLGGLIEWMASLDSTNSITKTMKESLFGDEDIPAQEIISPKVDGAQIEVGTDGDSYVIVLTNNNKIKRSSGSGAKDIPVMPWAEKFGKTFSFPVLEIETQNDEKLTGDWSAGGTITTKNGRTIITPPEWSSKSLAPGDFITFTLKSGKGKAEEKNIKSILLTQKAVSGGSVISSCVVYGSGSSQPAQDDKDDDQKKEEEKEDDKGKDKEEEKGGEQTGKYSEWSSENKAYALGDLVQYRGKVYECINPHNSNVAWTPTDAFTLWKLRKDLTA